MRLLVHVVTCHSTEDYIRLSAQASVLLRLAPVILVLRLEQFHYLLELFSKVLLSFSQLFLEILPAFLECVNTTLEGGCVGDTRRYWS